MRKSKMISAVLRTHLWPRGVGFAFDKLGLSNANPRVNTRKVGFTDEKLGFSTVN